MAYKTKRRISSILYSAFLVVTFVACSNTRKFESAPQGPPLRANKPANKIENRDILQVGDTLEVFVMEDSSFNGVFKIREKGDIIIPKVGRVSVTGLTVEMAQQTIKKTLESSQLTSATVIADRISAVGSAPVTFEESPQILVYLTGKVNRPGQHMLALSSGDTITAYEAVLIAGGVAQFADERDAYILRRTGGNNRTKIPVDLRSIRQGKSPDVPLANGDMICVPERRFAL